MANKKGEQISLSKDHLQPEQRSANMAKINLRDTSLELKFRSALHRLGLRFRKNVKRLPGTPDIVLPKYRTVIFVNGCFWHRHDCKRGRSVPTHRKEFWEDKFSKNVERDRVNYLKIKEAGWNVIVVWECELRHLEKKIDEVVQLLRSNLVAPV